MERLTYRLPEYHSDEPNGYYAVKYADTDYEAQDVINRLADYEDRKLTPEEIDKLKYEWAAATALIMGYSVPRLQELAEADRDGRLVVLPCKLGDTVYWVYGMVITECKVHRIQKNRNGLDICLKSNMSSVFRTDLSFGKTVFLTREEAEKALEEQNG